MEALILGIYAGIVWLIFFKYKLLPWNTVSKVVVFTIPVVGMIPLIRQRIGGMASKSAAVSSL